MDLKKTGSVSKGVGRKGKGRKKQEPYKRWTQEENRIYVDFLRENQDHFKN